MSAVPDDFARSAATRLETLTGTRASFRTDQLEAVHDLVAERKRVLCVQATGWGKSAVYFVATAMLRQQGAGPTVLISPLLALMRNQLAAASTLGLRAVTVNSTNRGEWDAIRDQLEADVVDLLLISPERLGNRQFCDRMLPLFIERVGLLVVDEAHCVSDWGHDFRPDYRRIRDIVAHLSENVAVLCTTATANDRVVADVTEQLQASAQRLTTYRGSLARSSLRLEVVKLPNPAHRLAWLARWLPRLSGSGIVYCLTKRDTETVSRWLNQQGISAIAYSGDVSDDERIAAEDRLLANDVKAVVATSALGMGYDKPDLGFVVHYQAPSSAIAYYQQVGRAGRGVAPADVILLRGAEDRAIQDFFIESAFPPAPLVQRVLVTIGEADGPLTVAAIQAEVNLGRGRIETLLKVLDVEGAVRREGSGWRLSGEPWTYDSTRYELLTALRRGEQQAMFAYGENGGCLMAALQVELDDPTATPCGRCSVCAGPRFDAPLRTQLAAQAQQLLRSQPLAVSVRRQTPRTTTSASRRLPSELLVREGRALARAGDGGWDALVHAGRRSGRFDDELVDACRELVAAWAPSPEPCWVCAVPSKRSGELVPGFGRRLAAALGLSYLDALVRIGQSPSQREMRNSAQQLANVRGQFKVTGALPHQPGLLLDDVRYSGWTLAMVGAQLRQAGAGDVYPLVLSLTGA
ncbi:MAG: RecQ family ATP-dependent DNA helicase [Solirubrobacteraceae bacterium]